MRLLPWQLCLRARKFRASTKPFGYMPFYPGPGLGGHCIPIDPFYLSWKAREHEMSAKFIELAGEINVSMVDYVIGRLREGLDQATGRGLKGTRVLLSGIAYKKNISDMRESPAMKIMTKLIESGALVDYFDPHVPTIPKMRNYPDLLALKSVEFEKIAENDYSAIVITTDHDNVDYGALAALDVLLVDTRNVLKRKGISARNVIKA